MAPIQRVLWEIGIKSCTGQCPNKNTTPKMRRRLEIHPQKMKESKQTKTQTGIEKAEDRRQSEQSETLPGVGNQASE